MNSNIYNIDSKFRNQTSYPNSANFVFNRTESLNGSNYRIEPFNEKNVIEMKIISLELPNTNYYILSSRNNNSLSYNSISITIPDGSYTQSELINELNKLAITSLSGLAFSYSSTTNKCTIINSHASSDLVFTASGTSYISLGEILGFTVPTTITHGTTSTSTNVMKDPQQIYFFLRINDFGNIYHNNRRYVAKIVIDNQARYDDLNQETTIKLITNRIKFEQPTDIKQLNISLDDEYGNNVNLNGSDWSFSLETIIITNTILKNYSEIRFYNDEVMDLILKAKMLSYYEKQANNNVNNTLTSTYNSNLTNLNNMQEYSTFGSRNNYSPQFSYFVDSDKNT
jgi:hypothetical protein